jgi:hypothetical protein
MIPARLTDDGTCPCGNPTARLPAGQKVGKGGGTHWRLCTRCFIEQQSPGRTSSETDEDYARRHGLLEGDDALVDMEGEYERRLKEER